MTNNPATVARVVGYVRLSRASDESTSVPRQRQEIQRAAERNGWTLVGLYEDVDVSASKSRLNRPGLSRVRAALANGEADAVVVWRLDRLARSVVDFGTLLDEGVNVISATEPLDTTTPMGRAMAEILQVFARMESETIGERLSSMIAYRVSQGDRWRGASAPYGYAITPHPSGDGKTLSVEPTEARYIRKALDIVLGGGSLYRAMRELDAAGSRPRKAAAWSLSSLRVVLTGDAVLGRQTRRGAPLRDEHGVIVQSWEPVLTVEESERVRATLAPTPVGQSRRKASRALSGLLVCETCGRRMRINSRRNSGGARIEAYGCRTNGDGARCAAPAHINADLVEQHIEREFLALAGRLPVAERREVRRDVVGLAEVVEAIAHTTDAMREPGADLANLAGRLGDLVAKRDDLAAQPAGVFTEFAMTGETFSEAWAGATVERRRTLLTGVLEGPIVITRGVRGRRGLDPARVLAPWVWLSGDRPSADDAGGESRNVPAYVLAASRMPTE